jgi:hypothetical protein
LNTLTDCTPQSLASMAKDAAQRLQVERIEQILRASADLGWLASIRNVIRAEVVRVITWLRPSRFTLGADPEIAKAELILSLLD